MSAEVYRVYREDGYWVTGTTVQHRAHYTKKFHEAGTWKTAMGAMGWAPHNRNGVPRKRRYRFYLVRFNTFGRTVVGHWYG